MAMSVTYTTFCGQIVKEDRNGTESFYVPDSHGSIAMILDAAGRAISEYAGSPQSDWARCDTSGEALFNLVDFEFTDLLLACDEDEDLGEI